MIDFDDQLENVCSFVPQNWDDVNKKFFVIFFHFISNELSISLKMPTLEDKTMSSGRHIATIIAFYDCLKVIFDYKNENIKSTQIFEDINHALIGLAESVTIYIDENNRNLKENCKIKFDKKFHYKTEILDFFNIFDEKMNDFFDSFQMHIDFEKVYYKATKNIEVKPSGSAQALLEFFNMTSHVLAIYNVDIREEDIKSNIDKALSHISRGTLDNYKSIIKTSFGLTGNDFLSFHEIIDSDTHLSLLEIREYEYLTLGKELSTTEKKQVILNYKIASNYIISKLADLDFTKKKPSIPTPLQKKYILLFSQLYDKKTTHHIAVGYYIHSILNWRISREVHHAEKIACLTYLYLIMHHEHNRIIDIQKALSLSKRKYHELNSYFRSYINAKPEKKSVIAKHIIKILEDLLVIDNAVSLEIIESQRLLESKNK